MLKRFLLAAELLCLKHCKNDWGGWVIVFLHGFHQRLVLSLGQHHLPRKTARVVRYTGSNLPALVQTQSIYRIEKSPSSSPMSWSVMNHLDNYNIDTRIQQLVLSRKYNHSTHQKTTAYPELRCVLHHCYIITLVSIIIKCVQLVQNPRVRSAPFRMKWLPNILFRNVWRMKFSGCRASLAIPLVPHGSFATRLDHRF